MDFDLKEFRKTRKERQIAAKQAYLTSPIENFEKTDWVDHKTIITEKNMMNIENYLEKLSLHSTSTALKSSDMTHYTSQEEFVFEKESANSYYDNEMVSFELINVTHEKNRDDNVFISGEVFGEGGVQLSCLVIEVNGKQYKTRLSDLFDSYVSTSLLTTRRIFVDSNAEELNIKLIFQTTSDNTYFTAPQHGCKITVKTERR